MTDRPEPPKGLWYHDEHTNSITIGGDDEGERLETPEQMRAMARDLMAMADWCEANEPLPYPEPRPGGFCMDSDIAGVVLREFAVEEAQSPQLGRVTVVSEKADSIEWSSEAVAKRWEPEE